MENARYFQQLHSGMINSLQDQLQDDLIARGYQVGKEASLQIFAGREPDLYIENTAPSDIPSAKWDYAAAAIEPGTPVAIQDDDFEALHIHDMQTG